MADFQKLGETVKRMRADGVPDANINGWLAQADTDLETLNASGFGPDSTRAVAPSTKLESFGQGFGQGASFGFGDELGAAAAATFGVPEGGFQPQGDSWGERYESARDKIRGELKHIEVSNPKTYMAGKVTGAVAPALVAPELYGSNWVAAAPTMGQAMGRSAMVSGGFGGVQSFGEAEGSAADQTISTLIGTGLSAAMGAGVPPLVAGLKAGYNRLANLFRPGETIIEAPTQAAADAVEAARPRVTQDVSATEKQQAVAQIAKALERAGYGTDDAAAQVARLGPEGTLADISEPTTRLLRTTKSAPGAAGQIAETALKNRQLGEQGRLMGSLRENIGAAASDLPENFYDAASALIQKRSADSTPLYKAFEEANGGITWNDDLAKLFQRPSLKQAYKKAIAIAADEGIELPQIAKLDPETGEVLEWIAKPDNRTLDFIKRGLDDVIEGAKNERGKITTDAGRAVQSLKRQFVDMVDELNPAYKAAREAYSGPSQSLKALEMGRDFVTEDAEITARDLADMTAGDKDLFRIGAMRKLIDVIKSNPKDRSVVNKLRSEVLKDKMREIFPTEEAFNKFVADAEKEVRFAGTKNAVLSGSQTVEKALDAADLARGASNVAQDVMTANKPGMIGRAADWASRLLGPGEGTRAAIARDLLESNPVNIQEIMRAIEALKKSQAGTKQISGIGAATVLPAAGSEINRGVFSGRQP